MGRETERVWGWGERRECGLEVGEESGWTGVLDEPGVVGVELDCAMEWASYCRVAPENLWSCLRSRCCRCDVAGGERGADMGCIAESGRGTGWWESMDVISGPVVSLEVRLGVPR